MLIFYKKFKNYIFVQISKYGTIDLQATTCLIPEF